MLSLNPQVTRAANKNFFLYLNANSKMISDMSTIKSRAAKFTQNISGYISQEKKCIKKRLKSQLFSRTLLLTNTFLGGNIPCLEQR